MVESVSTMAKVTDSRVSGSSGGREAFFSISLNLGEEKNHLERCPQPPTMAQSRTELFLFSLFSLCKLVFTKVSIVSVLIKIPSHVIKQQKKITESVTHISAGNGSTHASKLCLGVLMCTCLSHPSSTTILAWQSLLALFSADLYQKSN